jgi:uncharacterized protein YecT (DUF1311 family)
MCHVDTHYLVSLITQRKGTWDARHQYAHYSCEALKSEWDRNRALPEFVGDIYPVRAISLFEVFTRSWVRAIVEGSTAFAERAIPLIQTAKPDYRLVISITNKIVTFGDIVAHTVPVSNLEHVVSVFETLCDKKMPALLRVAVDRWETEVENKPATPIIDDYDVVCANVSKLFELRHMVCHEVPKLGSGSSMFADVGIQLKALTVLMHAFEEVLTNELFGKPPLTQSAMNERASKDYEEENLKMNVVLGALRDRYGSDARRLKLLNTAQSAWERYRKLQAIVQHDPIGEGSIGPMMRSFEAMEITKERTERLRVFLNAEDGWV